MQTPVQLLPTISPISFYSTHSSNLEEFRRIREEQDAEYSAMLENDMALENVCSVCVCVCVCVCDGRVLYHTGAQFC